MTPGLIDAHTHLGVYSEPTDWSAEDGNETSGPVTPAMDALDAINPADIAFDDALAGGVFGLARGVLLLFIFFALVPIIQAVVPIQQITDLLNASRLAPLFDSQLILSILGA